MINFPSINVAEFDLESLKSVPDASYGKTGPLRQLATGEWWHVEILRPELAKTVQESGAFEHLTTAGWLRRSHRHLAPVRFIVEESSGPVGLAYSLRVEEKAPAEAPPETVLTRARYHHGTILPSLLLDYFRQFCDALLALHQGEPGRDQTLRPAHNLLHAENCYVAAGHTLRVTGQGLAPLLYLAGPELLRAAVQEPRAEPFAAPEILRGASRPGVPPADIYSLGALVFFIAANLPYDPAGAMDVGTLAEPAQRPIEEVLRDCLRQEPTARLSGADKVLRRLDINVDAQGRILPANIPFAPAEARTSAAQASSATAPVADIDSDEETTDAGSRPTFAVRIAAGEAPPQREPQHSLEPCGCLIPGGRFIQGVHRGDVDERPVREVFLDAYYIAETAVTNATFREFLSAVGNDECRYYIENRRSYIRLSGMFSKEWKVREGYERHPVNNVTWEGAATFAGWLAGKTGRPWRLPTEAEWEAAARHGHEKGDELYPWGREFPTPLHARFGRSWNEEFFDVMVPVDALDAGRAACGALNMAGNVWEWCNDFYSRTAYQAGATANPEGPPKGPLRVARGGCWMSNSHELRTTARRGEPPVPDAALGMGFRLVLPVPEESTEEQTFISEPID